MVLAASAMAGLIERNAELSIAVAPVHTGGMRH